MYHCKIINKTVATINKTQIKQNKSKLNQGNQNYEQTAIYS